MHRLTLRILLLSVVLAVPAGSQTADTLSSSTPLFTTGDALLLSAFTIAAIAAAPADKFFTRQLRDPARQSNRITRNGSSVFRLFGHPGGMAVGTVLYAAGRLSRERRTQDLGLHTVESILLGHFATGTIKVLAGRARPYVDTANATNFKLGRGLSSDDYRSFPSGHTTAAFAFASIVSVETTRWWPDTRWIIGPAVYGAAALTGVSRIYNSDHWASDVVVGAAIGTLTGLKVYQYQHSHPDNRLDKLLLRAGVQSTGDGGWHLMLSTVRR